MPLREDLLTPIVGDTPSGVDVRYDSKVLLYDQIKEARRQDDNLDQGDWQHDRKMADYPQVIQLGQEALATKTKDLQVAAWLTEALLHTEGFSGLRQGLLLCQGLIANFWETLYPPIEESDLELRAAPLDWLGAALELPLKSIALVRAGYDWYKFKESRVVGYEAQVQNNKEKEARAQRLAEGKLAPELFDKALAETPKAFYLQSEKELDGCLEALKSLDELCSQKYGDAAPSLGKLKIALGEVRHTVHTLLQKKRETEPDSVREALGGIDQAGRPETTTVEATAVPGIVIPLANSEPPDRREAVASVAKAAAILRRLEPYSPAPYMIMRGLRWGELRVAAQLSDATLLEGPPAELRQHIKRLALSNKWEELLETAENAMSLPCSRGWLDLQRAVVDACTALGERYEPIAAAIRSGLTALLKDMPQLLDTTLLDDTPAANAETKAWLNKLLAEAAPQPATPQPDGSGAAAPANERAPAPSWPAKSLDPYALAQQALQAGQAEKAFEIMRAEIDRQRCGRGRFERRLQLVQLCIAAGKPGIAQPVLEDVAAAVETHKLEDWEDRSMIAGVLATIMTTSSKVKEDSGERQKLFERICRLDPVQALRAG